MNQYKVDIVLTDGTTRSLWLWAVNVWDAAIRTCRHIADPRTVIHTITEIE